MTGAFSMEGRDKLVNLCNKWEMDDSDKDTMTLEVDDYFMSTIYSVVKLLDKKGEEGSLYVHFTFTLRHFTGRYLTIIY